MNKNTIPENFTLSLVLADAIPVIFFSLNMIILGSRFESPLFIFGSILCFLGGLGKVIWKLIVVLHQKNIWILFVQFRFLMPAGLVFILMSLILGKSRLSIAAFIANFTSMPSFFFFSLGLLGMLMMFVFAIKMDSSDAKSNWIEQLTNGLSQISIFIGILLL
ncbi:MAG: hypothetical protein K5675_03360 [Lachnospiraceae bacterium]|nr:hypothetical protein [Lachnospiraceae bacterium]